MQADQELSEATIEECKREWLFARNDAVKAVERLTSRGLHKQTANRILEPFLWHTVIITATEWENFFAQRCHPAAQPEMRAAAEAIRVAVTTSTPAPVSEGSWHLPYVSENEGLALELAKKVSVARCARVSYLTQDGVRDTRLDLELHDRLVGAVPPHASPFEHVARPCRFEYDCEDDHYSVYHEDVNKQGNFKRWVQYRHELGI
jgi:hypothetical protein